MKNLDQAERLRQLTKDSPTGTFLKHGRTRKPPRIISVVSGRGGVGKSFFTLNIGCFWALKGKNTLLIDADYALGNLDYLLGLNPEYTIQHLITGKASYEKAVQDGPWGLKLVPGMAGLNGNPNLPGNFSNGIIRDLAMHDNWADILFCDTTSGISEPTVDIIQSSDEMILITTPETASVIDLFAMIKFLHQKLGDNIPRMRFVVNRVTSRDEGRKVAASLRSVIGRYLGKGIHYMGAIPADPQVDKASRKHIPFIRHAPTSPAARMMEDIAFMLLDEWDNPIDVD